jgi:hypothetical protein
MVMFAATSAMAFHDAGVATCSGCHTMHNSQDGADVGATGSFDDLLLYNGASETCLSCHAVYGQFMGGEGYGPGGDFYWVTKTWSWTAHGHAEESTGDSHGHNVITDSYGIAEDAALSQAPGGDFLSARLACTSCHDPHGRQTFRLLYDDQGDGPKYDGARYDFASDAPNAWGNSRRTYVGGGGDETNSKHTIYKSGMSDWCANCHTNFHTDNAGAEFVHPVGQNLGDTAGHYNAYVNSGDYTGSQATAYWGLVPFEDVSADPTTELPGNYTTGPESNDKVMCVSCHRAHASAFSDIGRWDFGADWIAESIPYQTGWTDSTETVPVFTGGASAEDVQNKYYQYTFVAEQKSLCNKCHYKDQFDDLTKAP